MQIDKSSSHVNCNVDGWICFLAGEGGDHAYMMGVNEIWWHLIGVKEITLSYCPKSSTPFP